MSRAGWPTPAAAAVLAALAAVLAGQVRAMLHYGPAGRALVPARPGQPQIAAYRQATTAGRSTG
jgi:hypothetical protein